MAKQWFKMDFDAYADPKVVRLRVRHGWEGFGLYVFLIGRMGQEGGYTISLNHIPEMAMLSGTDPDKMQAVVTDCIEAELFESDGESFWANRLVNDMQEYDKKLQVRSAAGKASGKSRREKARQKRDANKCSTDVQQMPNKQRTNRIEESRVEDKNKGESDDSPLRDVFDRTFWQEYRKAAAIENRRPGSKQKAFHQWKKLSLPMRTEALAALILQWQAARAFKAAGEFYPAFPDAERWLRDRRWEDEIPDPPTNSVAPPPKAIRCSFRWHPEGEIDERKCGKLVADGSEYCAEHAQ